jgi:DNA-binding PadR family transcriptional regulator
MRRPIGSFWPAGHSQIYPEPARLEAARFLRHRVVDRLGRRETKRYTITEAGRKALREWIIEPTRRRAAGTSFC